MHMRHYYFFALRYVVHAAATALAEGGKSAHWSLLSGRNTVRIPKLFSRIYHANPTLDKNKKSSLASKYIINKL